MIKLRKPFDLVDYDPLTGVTSVEGLPVTLHCNVFNHFFTQGIKIALGKEEGREVIYKASELAHYRILRRLKDKFSLSEKDTYEVGIRYFRSRGLGRLYVEDPKNVYLISSNHANTHIKLLRYLSDIPLCDVERGFIAALLEVALNLNPGTIRVEEDHCLGSEDPVCHMRTERGKGNYDIPRISTFPTYKVEEGYEMRKMAMKTMIKSVPAPDNSGIISIKSAFTDLKKVWLMQLPGEYYALANLEVIEKAGEDIARYVFSLASFSCTYFTYFSLLRMSEENPMARMLFMDAKEPDDYFNALATMSNFTGFGLFTVDSFERNGNTINGTFRFMNFYENIIPIAMDREPVSFYILGMVLAKILAIYKHNLYDPSVSMSFMEKAMEDFDTMFEKANASLHTTDQGVQTLNVEVKM